MSVKQQMASFHFFKRLLQRVSLGLLDFVETSGVLSTQ